MLAELKTLIVSKRGYEIPIRELRHSRDATLRGMAFIPREEALVVGCLLRDAAADPAAAYTLLRECRQGKRTVETWRAGLAEVLGSGAATPAIVRRLFALDTLRAVGLSAQELVAAGLAAEVRAALLQAIEGGAADAAVLPLIAPETANEKVDVGKKLYHGHDGKVVLARWAVERGASAAVVTALLGAHGTVEAHAFRVCETLEYIAIPDCVKVIGRSAFFNCSALKSITLSETLEIICPSAFCNCDAVESIDLPTTLHSLGDHAFHSCRALKSIIIPPSVRALGERSFAECDALKAITLSLTLKNSMQEARLTGEFAKKPDLKVTFTPLVRHPRADFGSDL